MVRSETTAALRRAMRRAAFHLLRAALESVKAIEAVVDELASVGHDDSDNEDGETHRRVHIEVE